MERGREGDMSAVDVGGVWDRALSGELRGGGASGAVLASREVCDEGSCVGVAVEMSPLGPVDGARGGGIVGMGNS